MSLCRWRRGPGGLCGRRALRTAAVPTLLAALLAGACFGPWRADLGEANAPAAASPWLALPMLVAAASVVVTTILFWPAFGTRRPGSPWLDRVQRGRLGGLGAAIAGALLAQFVVTLPLATLLAPWLGAPATARADHALSTDAPVLDASRPVVTFVVPTDEPLAGLWLRPLVGLPSGAWLGTTVAVYADGERLPELARPFADNRQLARLPLPGRVVREIRLQRVDGNVPLVFADGSAGLVGATAHAGAWNGVRFALLALLPTFVALALAAVCGLAAGLPTVLAVAISALFLATVGGLGIFDHALLSLFRGQWLASDAVFPRCAASLAVGCLAMIVTMLLRPRICR